VYEYKERKKEGSAKRGDGVSRGWRGGEFPSRREGAKGLDGKGYGDRRNNHTESLIGGKGISTG